MKRKPDALILRRNWRDTREYLAYVEEVRQAKAGTVAVYRGALDLLLRWARDCSLPRLSVLRPVFPAWLDNGERAASYQEKTCRTVRQFLVWAKTRFFRYESLTPDAIEAMRPAAGEGQVREREIWTVEDVREVLALDARTLTEERDRAAVAMLFLSGMRIGAFTTLPIRAVDLDRWMVHQWPSYGVRTKNSKAANTWLLGIDDLREVVVAWDGKVRESLPASAMWYALLDPSGRLFAEDQEPGRHRGAGFNKRLRRLCRRAGVPYRSAHKLRHGCAVWMLRNVVTMAEYKAASQNLMHESVVTTDKIYSPLLENDVEAVITRLGDAQRDDDDRVLDLVRDLLSRMERARL